MISRQIIRTGIAASAAAHLSVLMLVLLFSEVHRFGSVTAEPITVDLVPSDEIAPTPTKPEPPPEPEAQPSDAIGLSSNSAASGSPAPAAPPAAPARPLKQAAPPPPNRQQASVQPQPQPQPQPQLQSQPQAQPQPQPQPLTASPAPVFTPPEPDLSIKYHVMLGLPPELPVEPPKSKSGDDFDAPASKMADIESSLVTEFRRHLKTCSKLPGSIAPSDKLRITLRAFLTPAGKLAAAPILIEASASAKGPVLMQSAIAALEACQPYTMLPATRYGEWKVMDLSFTPQDFAGG